MNEKELPGIIEDYHGYRLHRFEVGGLEAIVVEPKTPKSGRQ